MKKKAELTTTQIVTIVILVVSFIVLVAFFVFLNFGKTSSEEVCRNSVLLSSKGLTDSSVNCKTDYICLSKSGRCEKQNSVEIIKVKDKDELFSVLAEKMKRCWWMFGEGKYDYAGSRWVNKNVCSFCSEIYFDESVSEFLDGERSIPKDELYVYLAKNNVSDLQTYSEYLYGSNDVASLIFSQTDSYNKVVFGEIDIQKPYYVVMGIQTTLGNNYKWLGAAVVGLAVASIPLTGGVSIGTFIVAGAGVGVHSGLGSLVEMFNPEVVGIIVSGKGIPNSFLAPIILEVESDKLETLNCGEVITLS